MAWKKEIKVEEWRKNPDYAIVCGVDSDGDVGIFNETEGFSIILSPQGALDLANWINGLDLNRN